MSLPTEPQVSLMPMMLGDREATRGKKALTRCLRGEENRKTHFR